MACFREDSDFLLYLAYLRVLARKFECAVHAYCLMTNHVHLFLTPTYADACGGLMKELSQRYAHYFNKRYKRTGTLWEGRFRSCVAESARYVLACYRYIELNPVRAGMTSHPSGYSWSSYPVNSGQRSDPLVRAHAEYTALGESPEIRHAAYKRLVADSLDPSVLASIRHATNGGYPLVSDDLKARLASSPTRKLDRGRAGRPVRKSVPDPDFVSGGGAS